MISTLQKKHVSPKGLGYSVPLWQLSCSWTWLVVFRV